MSEPYLTVSIKRGAESQSLAVQQIVKKYITNEMNGLDIGSAGSPITINAISLDRANRHFSELVQLRGDARNLIWFKNGVMDYIFSSHCYEDFSENEKPTVLQEWTRVIKQGGYLILLLPDEQKYRAFCAKHNSIPNGAHKDPTFSLDTVKKIAATYCPTLIEVERADIGSYSFLVVYKVK